MKDGNTRGLGDREFFPLKGPVESQRQVGHFTWVLRYQSMGSGQTGFTFTRPPLVNRIPNLSGRATTRFRWIYRGGVVPRGSVRPKGLQCLGFSLFLGQGPELYSVSSGLTCVPSVRG